MILLCYVSIKQHSNELRIFFNLTRYYFKYFPFLITFVALYEIQKDSRSYQSLICLALSLQIVLFTFWYVTTSTYKKLVYEKLGHISFHLQGEKDNLKYHCDYDFDVKLGVTPWSKELINEIKQKKVKLLDIVKTASKQNCTKDNFEEYINKKYLNKINENLKSGKVVEISFDNLSDSISLRKI